MFNAHNYDEYTTHDADPPIAEMYFSQGICDEKPLKLVYDPETEFYDVYKPEIDQDALLLFNGGANIEFEPSEPEPVGYCWRHTGPKRDCWSW